MPNTSERGKVRYEAHKERRDEVGRVKVAAQEVVILTGLLPHW
jgi:hypothetical protein